LSDFLNVGGKIFLHCVGACKDCKGCME